jgi:methionine aminotransferase
MYSKFISPDHGLVDEIAGISGILNLAGSNLGYGGIPQLDDLLREAMIEHTGQSVSPFGQIELREKVAAKIATLYGHDYSPDSEITITSGSNQAFYASIAAFVGEGDEVMLFEPANDAYLPAILLNGGKPVYISLKEPDFHIDWEEVMRMITSKTRMIIINTPHNPTGMLLNELDMLRLQKIISGTRIVVLSDESFEHIVYDGLSHQSVSLYPKLIEKSIVVNSFNHTCQVPGWNVGYCVAPALMMKEIRRVLKVMGASVFIPFQKALLVYISNKETYQGLGKIYQEKRDFFTVQMESLTRLVPIPTFGTYYQLYSYKNICDDRDNEVAHRLITEFGVGAAPYSAFFHEKSKRPLLRFNISQSNEVLAQVAERLKSF